jgi:hypothetical protein
MRKRKIERKPPPQNVVGQTVRKLRFERGWTQAMLTARCARAGWDVGEGIVAKIEGGFRCVADRELIYLARALKVKLHDLFPNDPGSRSVK